MDFLRSLALPHPLAPVRPSAERRSPSFTLLATAAVLALALLAGATGGVRDAEAAFPGTNGPIACSGPLQEPNPVSRLEIFTMNDSGSMDAQGNPTSQVRLMTNFSSDYNPRYSADGRKITFIKEAPAASVWTMDAEGGNERQLTFAAGGATGFTDSFIGGFSPDGSKIVFQRSVAPAGAAPRNFEVFTVNVDGTGLTNLTNNQGATLNSDSQPSWSPDGTKIAFQSNRAGNPDIWVMNANGSSPVNLTASSTADESAPEWSPDGTQIAFVSDRDFIPRTTAARNLEIYRMNATGSNVVRLTFNDYNPPTTDFAGYDLFPHWSPQGDRIVFHSGRGSEFGAAQWDVFTINSATGENPTGGSPARRLTRREANDERCGWGVLTHRLSVTKVGGLYGTVTSSYPGIDCGDDCSDIFKDNLQVTLIATPAAGGSRFFGFSGGGCGGTARTCTVTMSQARSVTATFGPPLYPLPLYPGPLPPFADCPSGTANVIRGTAASESIVGTPRADRIFAGTGNDTVDGRAGNDCIDLGPGTDRGQGGSGNDLILGGLGADRISGSSGNDRLRGGSSADRLIGGLGNDRVAGDQGNDRVSGNSGNDRVSGSSGRDRLNGGSGRDRISGGSGNDSISARDRQRDRINCGSGRDRVVADRIDVVSRSCERVRPR